MVTWSVVSGANAIRAALPTLRFFRKIGLVFFNELRINFTTCRLLVFGLILLLPLIFLGLYVRSTFKLVYQVNAFKF